LPDSDLLFFNRNGAKWPFFCQWVIPW